MRTRTHPVPSIAYWLLVVVMIMTTVMFFAGRL